MKSRYIKLATLILAGGFILYTLLALVPYMGRVSVSQETRDAFSMERFYGQMESPERVLLLEAPRDAFFHRMNLISNAEEQILLASFSIHEGETSDMMVGALLAAADRGVDVRILNNGSIAGFMPSRYRDILAVHPNIDVYLFNQFEFFRPQYLNAALHDKYMVVDDSFLIFGGRNIGDKYYAPAGYTGRLSLDREVLVYNTDPAFQGSISEVRDYFARKRSSDRTFLQNGAGQGDWEAQRDYFVSLYLAHRDRFAADDFDYYANTIGVNQITLLTDPFDTGGRKESIVAYNLMMIARHSEVIVAQSPYVVLTNPNFAHLADTVRGRDVTLSTNSLASTPNLPAFSSYYVSRRNLLNTGMTIYEYQSTQAALHGKTYLFDGRLTAIGSFNLNERSIRSDTESMLIIDSETFHDIVLEAIHDQIAQSLRVGADNRYALDSDVEAAQVPFGKRPLYLIVGQIMRLFRFLS